METRMNAGYTITDSVHIGNAEFVIGENHTQYGTMYVTWECKDGDSYFWGHYLSSRQAAETDLLDRAGRELEFQNRQKEKQAKSKERER